MLVRDAGSSAVSKIENLSHGGTFSFDMKKDTRM